MPSSIPFFPKQNDYIQRTLTLASECTSDTRDEPLSEPRRLFLPLLSGYLNGQLFKAVERRETSYSLHHVLKGGIIIK